MKLVILKRMFLTLAFRYADTYLLHPNTAQNAAYKGPITLKERLIKNISKIDFDHMKLRFKIFIPKINIQIVHLIFFFAR